jgi:hypothetical protein
MPGRATVAALNSVTDLHGDPLRDGRRVAGRKEAAPADPGRCLLQVHQPVLQRIPSPPSVEPFSRAHITHVQESVRHRTAARSHAAAREAHTSRGISQEIAREPNETTTLDLIQRPFFEPELKSRQTLVVERSKDVLEEHPAPEAESQTRRRLEEGKTSYPDVPWPKKASIGRTSLPLASRPKSSVGSVVARSHGRQRPHPIGSQRPLVSLLPAVPTESPAQRKKKKKNQEKLNRNGFREDEHLPR